MAERGIVWDRFRPACKKQFAKNKNRSVVGVAKLSDGKKLPVSFVQCVLGRWSKRRTAFDSASQKWQKLGQFTRVLLDAKQPHACVPTDWGWQRDAVGTLAAPGVSSPPQRASLEHLFVLQPTVPILQPPASPTQAATPPRPPPRRTSKTASAAPVLIWDKWDLCSTKGAWRLATPHSSPTAAAAAMRVSRANSICPRFRTLEMNV